MMCKSFLFLGFLMIGATKAVVNVKGEWKPRSGWEVTCSWQTMINDSLQSVRLYRNDHQYIVFRPEVSGPILREDIPSSTFLMMVDCRVSTGRQRGRCVTSLIVNDSASATEDVYTCEVSGERPTFLQERGTFDAYVPPSEAVVTRISEGDAEVLNCTSSGLPPPRLVWSVDGRKIPGDFTTASWDPETKLWHSWSSYRPHQSVLATCRPEVINRKGQIVTGVAASSAQSIGNYGMKSRVRSSGIKVSSSWASLNPSLHSDSTLNTLATLGSQL